MSITTGNTKRSTFAFRLRESADTSSIKYLPKLMRAKSRLHCVFWMITFAIGVAEGLYLTASLLDSYFAYDVTTSLSTQDRSRPPFPDVTLCNLNPLWNNGPGWGILAHIEGTPEPLTFDKYINRYYAMMTQSNITSFEEMIQDLSSVSGYLKHAKFNNTSLDHYGKTFIWRCFWKTETISKNCTVSPVITPINGLCYTVRPPPGEGITVHTRREGLSLILFLNNLDLRFVAEYRISPYQSYTAGAKVLVHPQGTFPNMAEGILVAPGSEAKIVANYQKRIKLPDPFSNCKVNLSLDIFDNVKLNKLWNYTEYACKSLCYVDQILESCGCLDSTEISVTELNKRFRFCSLLKEGKLNETLLDFECVRKVKSKLYENKMCSEKCPEPCERVYYKTSNNQVPWPLGVYTLGLYNFYLKSDYLPDEFDQYYGKASSLFLNGNITEAKELVKSTDLIQRNFIQLSITMNDATTTQADQQAVTLSSVFGSLGGILNLWIGFTLVTVMEIIDFVLTIAMENLCPNKLHKDRQNGQGVKSNQAQASCQELRTHL